MLYHTVVVDPPWPMPDTGATTNAKRTHSTGTYVAKSGRVENADWRNRSSGSQTKIPYQVMTVDAIAALSVKNLAEKNAHLYLWTVNRYIEDAYAVARAWGFTPSTMIVWCKPPMGIGFGGTYCNTTEYVLFARRGTCKALSRIDTTWFLWSRPYVDGHIAHSKKPEPFMDMVEIVSPGPRVELFSRSPRLGWDAWGLECESTPEVAAIMAAK